MKAMNDLQEIVNLCIENLDKRIQLRSKQGFGRLTVVAGPSLSGKTTRLNTLARDAKMAVEFSSNRPPDQIPKLIRYYMHDDSPRRTIERDLNTLERGFFGPIVSITREGSASRLNINARKAGVDMVFIDDVHLFGSDIVDVCESLATDLAINVTVAGNPLTANGKPNVVMSALLCSADEIEVLSSICSICGKPASRSASIGSAETLGDAETPPLQLTFSNVIMADQSKSLVREARLFQPRCRACMASRGLPPELFGSCSFNKYGDTSHSLYVIAGPPFSGKTEDFIRETRHFVAAGLKTQAFYALQNRNTGPIEAYNGRKAEAISINCMDKLFDSINSNSQVVSIDSFEALSGIDDSSNINRLDQLVSQGMTFIIAARGVDEGGRYIKGVGELLCFADRIKKLTSVCYKCGARHSASRIIDIGEYAEISKFKVARPGKNYRPICRTCIRNGKL